MLAARSKPYFFNFDTQKKPGKIIADCVVFETVELDADIANDTLFTLLGADIEKDRRIRQMVDIVRRTTY